MADAHFRTRIEPEKSCDLDIFVTKHEHEIIKHGGIILVHPNLELYDSDGQKIERIRIMSRNPLKEKANKTNKSQDKSDVLCPKCKYFKIGSPFFICEKYGQFICYGRHLISCNGFEEKEEKKTIMYNASAFFDIDSEIEIDDADDDCQIRSKIIDDLESRYGLDISYKRYECQNCTQCKFDDDVKTYFCRRSYTVISPDQSACDDFELDYLGR